MNKDIYRITEEIEDSDIKILNQIIFVPKKRESVEEKKRKNKSYDSSELP